MSSTLLRTQDLTARFGGHVAVDGVSCAFAAGALTAIIGPNGAGKTTYFDLISGQVNASTGRVFLGGRDISRMPVAARARAGIGRAFQLTNLFPNLSVMENLRLVAQSKSKRRACIWSMASRHRTLIEAAEQALEQVQLKDQRFQKISELSHGDQRKLEVAMLMTLDPLVYMFDEPTAGMSMDEAPVVLDLIAALKQRRDRTILLVEHKMDVIRALADRIIVLNNGCLAADGAPAEVMESDIVQEAYIGRGLEGALNEL
ncbi:ATP-binding cassette domain-containing protein [Epibacterium sp. SM1979]|uniref:ATP-binding cassette domain-containing protein n=1 Tax=Tritonibacter litoralis TaxID=2662264 RepID=A0A843YGN4_9RHOB|nr:ABC transporter ATP-binding protein [Tritonibacter litoralis]MQQ08604.1 ATP-binding cassette domain-containing protein [Tritonibacter litoralis]